MKTALMRSPEDRMSAPEPRYKARIIIIVAGHGFCFPGQGVEPHDCLEKNFIG